MASAKLQKPANEEHKFSQKISEVTAWGSRVFGHKQEQQAVPKHCTTCQCPASTNTKPTCTDTQKKEHPKTLSVKDTKSGACSETKKKEGHASIVHKDAKHTNCIELKNEKQLTTKDSKQPAGAEMKKKEKKQHHAESNTISKKENKDDPANHCFSSMADHWKEKILMLKKAKDSKYKDSSSSDSDSENESCVMKKTDKTHSQVTKTTSK